MTAALGSGCDGSGEHTLLFRVDIPEPTSPGIETVVTSATLKLFTRRSHRAHVNVNDSPTDDVVLVTVYRRPSIDRHWPPHHFDNDTEVSSLRGVCCILRLLGLLFFRFAATVQEIYGCFRLISWKKRRNRIFSAKISTHFGKMWLQQQLTPITKCRQARNSIMKKCSHSVLLATINSPLFVAVEKKQISTTGTDSNIS